MYRVIKRSSVLPSFYGRGRSSSQSVDVSEVSSAPNSELLCGSMLFCDDKPLHE